MRFLFLLITFISLSAVQTPASHSAELVWQVEHPFRFLRYASDHRVHELAFEAASSKPLFKKYPVSTMEALLNDPAWWRTKTARSSLSPYKQVAKIRRERETGKGKRKPLSAVSPDSDVQNGWAALQLNAKNGKPHEATCWNMVKQTHDGCLSDSGGMDGSRHAYMMPKLHYINVELKGAPKGLCRFNLTSADNRRLPNGAAILISGTNVGKSSRTFDTSCRGPKLRLKLPFSPNQKTSENLHQYQLSAATLGENTRPDGRLNLEVKITTRDFVVVAMGDSFASGEGNPDVPAKMDATITQTPSFGIKNQEPERDYGFPRRAGTKDTISLDSAAEWVDRRCHRSMYGSVTRAAIALAFAGERHHAITFINFSCSGAEITDGLLWPQDGQECIGNFTGPRAKKQAYEIGDSRFMEPQISGVVRELGLNEGANKVFTSGRNLHPKDPFNKYLETGIEKLRRENGYCAVWPGAGKSIKGRWFSGPRLHKRPLLKTAKLKRKIDLLFLSIGGNDIGFAALVKASIVNKLSKSDKLNSFLQRPLVSKIFRKAIGGVNHHEAKERITRDLGLRYELLNAALRTKLELKASNKRSRVVIAAYPSIARLELGGRTKYCAPNHNVRKNLGMSVSGLLELNPIDDLGGTGKADARDAEDVVRLLNDKIAASVKNKWRFTNKHKARFWKHAICAEGTIAGVPITASAFDLPRKHNNESADRWRLQDGTQFNPSKDVRYYAKRKRWFRTNNDVFMGIHSFKENANMEQNLYRKGRISAGIYNATRATSGAFHPTAEGHAAIADSYVEQGLKVLNLKWKN